jgi:hypothetical protein
LRQFDTCVSEVRAAGCHCLNELTNASTIVKFHILREAVLIILVQGPDSGVEFFEPVLVCGEGRRSVIRDGNGVHPCPEVFLANFFNEGVTVNLDVIASFGHIDTIKHVQVSLVLDGDGETVIQHIEEDVCCALVRCSNGKIINLTLKYYMFAINDIRVETWFMNSRHQSNFMEDGIGMLFLKARRLRVALHSRKDRDDMAIWNWGAFEMDGQPVMEGTVRPNKETL